MNATGTPGWLRRRRRESRDERYVARLLALGYRGVYCAPEVGLPGGYDPPSAALRMQREPDENRKGTP